MKDIVVSLRIFIVLSVLIGVIYPLAVTAIGEGLFPYQARGSILYVDGKAVGSELIAQKFVSDKYFWPRPSAADYATVPSGASNAGPISEGLQKAVAERREQGAEAEMLFTSGSGLDPHISPETARLQMRRIVGARQLSPAQTALVERLIQEYIENRQGGILGEARVNVLKLNLALDKRL